jgi:L-alanine-DL-glutamate epimerase-like enolase superfamily enzyme
LLEGAHPNDPIGLGDAPRLPGFEAAQAAIDNFAVETAELVRAAQIAGVPLYAVLVDRFMGGSMPPPAHGVRIHETCALRQAMPVAARCLLRGVETMKVKFDPQTAFEQSLKTLQIMRSTHPRIGLRVDLGDTLTHMVRLGEDPCPPLAALAQLDLEYVEGALDSALLEILPDGLVPLAVDLAQTPLQRAREAIECARVHTLVLKPHLCGSYGAAFDLAQMARAQGVQVVLSSLYDSPVGITALLHMVLALGLDHTAHGLNTLNLIYPHPHPALRPNRQGRIVPPAGAGLGLGAGPWHPKL